MGMQCTFSYSDLQDQTQWDIVSLHNTNSDTWSVEVWSKPAVDWEQREKIADFGLIVPENREAGSMYCWFDVGSWSEEQQWMIGLLVRNRICFTCS